MVCSLAQDRARWARLVLDVASRRRAAMTHWLERLAENHKEYLSRPR
jgi:hypothetical protein